MTGNSNSSVKNLQYIIQLHLLVQVCQLQKQLLHHYHHPQVTKIIM